MPGTRLRVGAARVALAVALLWGLAPGAAAQISEGEILVTDRLADAVIRIEPNGDQTLLDLGGSINSPFGLGFDGDGFLYITSTGGTIWRARHDPAGGSQDLVHLGSPLLAPRGIVVAPTEGVCADQTTFCTDDFDCRSCDDDTGLCVEDGVTQCATEADCPGTGTCNHFASNGTIYVAEAPPGSFESTIWTIDTATGAFARASQGGFLKIPFGIARENTGKLLVTDASTINFTSLLRIDPEAFDPNNRSGNQKRVSDAGLIVVPRRLAIQKNDVGETTAVFLSDSGGFPLLGLGHCSDDDLAECVDNEDCEEPLHSPPCVFENFGPKILCIDPDSPFDFTNKVASLAERAAGVFQNQTRVTSGGFFQRPVGIALEDPGTPGMTDSGSLLVADADAQAIIRVTFTPGDPEDPVDPDPCPAPDSGTQTVFSPPGGIGGNLDLPWDLQIVPELVGFVPRPYFVTDSGPDEDGDGAPDGAVYYVDPSNDTRCEVLPGSFERPTGLTLDLDGNLVVADEALGQVFRIVDPRSNCPPVVPPPPVVPTLETLVAESETDFIEAPTGVVVDSEGDVLVIDRAAPGAIVRVRPDGSQVLIDLRDPGDPLDPLVGPISATLGTDGQLIVAAEGDEPAGDVPRLVQVDPASGFAAALAPPVPPLPPLFDVATDLDGSNVISSDGGPGSERLVRQFPPVTNPLYRTESNSDDFESPRGIGIDVNRSVLVVDAGDESPATVETNPILRVDTISPADTSPVPVNTVGDLYDPFDVVVDIVRPRPVLDIDGDGVLDGRDNCALPERLQQAGVGANAPSVCSGDERTPCSIDEDECAAQDLGQCLVTTCAGDGSTQCSDDSDCQLELGICLDAVCSADGTTPCADDAECIGLGLGFCLDSFCSADGTKFCSIDADCELIGAGVCVDTGCADDRETSCGVDADCQIDLGLCGDLVCSADGLTGCDPDMGKCAFLLLGECVQLDEDGDGRGNACDNCQLTPNADPDNPQFAQLDADLDGFGDACDPTCDINRDGRTDSDDIDAFGAAQLFTGTCSLELIFCDDDSECPDQTCDTLEQTCSLDGGFCTEDVDCAAHLCGPSTADCNDDGDIDGIDQDILDDEIAAGIVLGPSFDFDEDFLADEHDNCFSDFNPSVCSVDGDLCDLPGVGFPNPVPCDGTQTCAQPDADQDGIGDACNDFIDLDGDEIADALDTCIADPNDGRCSLDGSACRFDSQCPEGETCQLIGKTCDGTRIADGGMPCTFDGDCASGETCQQPDEDADTIGDACDACPGSPEPSLCSIAGTECTVDTDCPEEPTGEICDFVPDRDGDFIQNSCDICPDDFDPRRCADDSQICRFDSDCISGATCLPQPNQDGDALPDACDPDVDGDGIEEDGDGSGTAGDGLCTGGNTILCDDNCGQRPLPAGAGTFPAIPNPGQEDEDADGFGDVCDPCLGDDNTEDNTDGDLIHAGCDVCPDDFDPRRCSETFLFCVSDASCPSGETCLPQPDLDGDLLGDACDPDVDEDGINEDGDNSGTPGDMFCTGGETQDCDDNCPSIPNPGQEDEDADGFGDACDPCLGDPDTSDGDGDGVHDGCDNCPTNFNVRLCSVTFLGCVVDAACPMGETCQPQADFDMDGEGDICDADADGDGFDDASEDNCPGPGEANPDQFDASGDGIGRLCDADYNDDGMVGVPDFISLSAAFGSSVGEGRYDPDIDSQGDGFIGLPEFILLSGQFGGLPGPGKPGCDGTLPVPVGCNP